MPCVNTPFYVPMVEPWQKDVLAICVQVLGESAHCTNHVTCIVATCRLPALQVQVKPCKIHHGYYALKAQWPETVDENGKHGRAYGSIKQYVLCEKLSHYLGEILRNVPVQQQ